MAPRHQSAHTYWTPIHLAVTYALPLWASVSTRNIAIAPPVFTASLAYRGDGFTGRRFPLPCESESRFRRVPIPFTKFIIPPRIAFIGSSACWSGARFNAFAARRYSLGSSCGAQ